MRKQIPSCSNSALVVGLVLAYFIRILNRSEVWKKSSNIPLVGIYSTIENFFDYCDCKYCVFRKKSVNVTFSQFQKSPYANESLKRVFKRGSLKNFNRKYVPLEVLGHNFYHRQAHVEQLCKIGLFGRFQLCKHSHNSSLHKLLYQHILHPVGIHPEKRVSGQVSR